MNENSRGLNIITLYSAVVNKNMVSIYLVIIGGIITYSVAQIYAIDHRCQSGEKDENKTR